MQPDLLFVRKDRTRLISEQGVEGPPDLVVEVLSPSTSGRDRGSKLERYRHYGVAEYWFADLEGPTVEVRSLREGDALAAAVLRPGDVLRWTPGPGGETLEVDVAELLGGARSGAADG